MRVAIVYEPLDEIGPDPLDEAKQPRRLGDFIDENQDALVVWREWGEQFEGGWRDHVVGQGIWENLTAEQIDQVLGWLTDDEKPRGHTYKGEGLTACGLEVVGPCPDCAAANE